MDPYLYTSVLILRQEFSGEGSLFSIVARIIQSKDY
jgi:hypothetical protein